MQVATCQVANPKPVRSRECFTYAMKHFFLADIHAKGVAYRENYMATLTPSKKKELNTHMETNGYTRAELYYNLASYTLDGHDAGIWAITEDAS